MAKGDITVCQVQAIAAGGMGYGRSEGRSIFMDFTAPGDLVKLRIIDEKSHWAKGEVLELLETSSLRTEPPCALYTRCGGCSLQHLNYEAQLSAKAAILTESFERIGGFAPPGFTIRPSNPLEYRNRFQFHCMPGRRNELGFRERHGREVIKLPDCPIAVPVIRRILKDPKQRSIIPPPQKDRFTVYCKGDLVLSEGGQARGKVSIKGKELLVDAGVFFQSNAAMLELLLMDLETLAEKADRNLPMGDIYAGVGTFTAFLGDKFPEAELVEENSAALALARENAKGHIRRFCALSADEWIKVNKTKDPEWGLLIVDPPREGLSMALRQYLAVSKTKTLAYVSCDPATLARDSKDLVTAGFRLKELCMYDFYPQTAHIESLAVFKRDNES